MSENTADRSGAVGLPPDMRIRLGHALIERVAEQHDVRLLHIKGYSADDGLYQPGRVSSDIDVLIHPEHVSKLVEALQTRGWRTVTRFTTGSVFQHAMTLWHDTWGHVDIHRSFPGVDLPPNEFFEQLWRSRTSQLIAAVECTVPERYHQALLIVLHAARDPYRGASDVGHLRETLLQEDWDVLQIQAKRYGAGLAFAAATGALADFEDHPAHDVWSVVSAGGSRMELLQARARAEPSLRGRAKVLLSSIFANRDHLRMALQREPRLMDYVKELSGRAAEAWSMIKSQVKK